jgi:hypothetical protein
VNSRHGRIELLYKNHNSFFISQRRKSMKQKFSIAMSLAVILTMLLTSLALADNIVNDISANPGSDTFTAGGSTAVGYKIVANKDAGETPQATCNVTDGTTALVTINVPAGVTVTPGSLTFTTCGDFQDVTFKSTTPGDYTITVSVSDNGNDAYNITPAEFQLHVLKPSGPTDTTPPVLTLPGNITTEATGPSGAVVSFTTSALDAVDGPVAVTCLPASGSTFAIGTTSVNCSAADAAGNSSAGSFNVTVNDTTPPTISGTPSNITAEATSAAGVAVTYILPTASDIVSLHQLLILSMVWLPRLAHLLLAQPSRLEQRRLIVQLLMQLVIRLLAHSS